MSKFKNYIFDLDGTIINSSNEVMKCFKLAFEETQIAYDESRLTSNLIGPPLREIILSIKPEISEDEIALIIKSFRKLYDYETQDISVLYEGMYELLTTLKNQGDRVFMATFKPTKPTMRIIEQYKLDMFDDIYTIDKFEKNITKEEMIIDIVEKYQLEKSQTVMIGDAPSDVKAGKNAGINSFGVLWGYGDNKEPVKEIADKTFETPSELSAYISNSEQLQFEKVST